MAQIISASLDLTKINKSKIVNHQNGCKYYNIDIIVNDEKNKFGQDVSISTSQTKEERTKKAPKSYLGNGKTVWTGNSPQTQKGSSVEGYGFKEDDSLPF